jgi:hypothetical protein
MSRARITSVIVVLSMTIGMAPATSAATTTVVRPGQSIQAAINGASGGGTVVVARGTYRENLVITRSIRLIGREAVLVPAATPGPNPCGFAESGPPPVVGICVLGQVDAQFNVTRTVDNVLIQGFIIRGFSGDGLLAYGANNLHVVRNTVRNNGGYGVFANTSSNVSLLFNTSNGNHEAGLYVGDSPNAQAIIVGNHSYDNVGEGILFRDAVGGRITLNRLHGNCAGLFVLDTGAPGSGGGVTVALNQVLTNNRLCPGEEGEAPPFGGIGIGLLGAQGTSVVANVVSGNVAADGSALPGGGLLLLDTTAFGGTTPKANSIRSNVLAGNSPFDVFGDGTGSGNLLRSNSCTTSNVSGAC